MTYRINSTLVALHYRKAMYQRNMLVAWAVVLVIVAMVVGWLLYPASEPEVIVGDTWGGLLKGPELGRAGGQSRGEGEFAGQANVRYEIVRESPPALPTVGSHIYPVEDQAMTYGPTGVVGRPDVAQASGSGVGVGNGFGSGFADFGLPGRPIYAQTLGTARWPGSGRGSFLPNPAIASPAVIEWIMPDYPKGHTSSEVVCLVTLAADGAKTIRVLYTVTWVQFGGKRTSVQFFVGCDKWGFAQSVVSALDRSIFWPATDRQGRKLPGQFVMNWVFCPECPPQPEAVRVVRGDVLLRPGRG